MRPIACTFLCLSISILGIAEGTNLSSAEEGRCLAWMVRRVAGVDIPHLQTQSNIGPSRQGKRGPEGRKGERGIPGIQGIPGTCQCDMTGLSILRAENEAFAENLSQMRAEMAVMKSKLSALKSLVVTNQDVTVEVLPPTVALACSDSVKTRPSIFSTTVTRIRCPSGCQSLGGVWGSGIYTDDSRICKAAIHDGKIPSQGGTTYVKKMPGRTRYRSTTANGITTTMYGNWDASFKFCNEIEC